MFKRASILFVLILVFSDFSYGQQVIAKDTLEKKGITHLKAFSSGLVQNILLNRVNRHLIPTGRDWANVNFSTWKETLTTAPSWDWDLFTTNWFAHPYQGSMFYNGARNLGLSFYESTIYSVTGTLVWEFMGETYPASTNDLFTNIIGGFHLGEILYRLSENVLDDRAVGSERLRREVLAGMININGSLNRVIYGKAFDKNLHMGHERIPIKKLFYISNALSIQHPQNKTNISNPLIGLKLKYGDYSKPNPNISPYDYFDLSTWVRLDFDVNSDNVTSHHFKAFFNLSSHAIIYGDFKKTIHGNNILTGIFQHYDYFKNDDFELGSFALTYGYIFESPEKKTRLNLQAGPIILAAADSKSTDHVRPKEYVNAIMRDYVMGSGINTKFEISKTFFNKINISFNHGYWMLFSLSGVDGTETIHRFSGELGYDVSPVLNISLSLLNHYSAGDYEEEEYIFKDGERYSDFKIGASITLK